MRADNYKATADNANVIRHPRDFRLKIRRAKMSIYEDKNGTCTQIPDR